MPERGGATYVRQDDAEFRRAVEAVRSTHNISDVVAQWTKLTRAGREMKGLCLSHSEKFPSMRVNDAKGTVYCFGCGYSGDIFRVVQDKLGLSFIDALRWLGDAELPQVDPTERVRRKEEDEAQRQRDAADAIGFWKQCVPPAGTPAEIYARSRKITMQLPRSIRFGMLPAWRDKETGEWSKPRPAMVCACQEASGAIVGIQRIFLRDGGKAKAAMKRPKLTLGRIRGAALRLGPIKPEIIVCEGPEDGLSLAQELPGRTVWATLGTGLMAVVEYPPEITKIVIAGQNDAPGRAAADKAAFFLVEKGYAVDVRYPDPAFRDWNDQLRGIRQ